MQIKSKYDVIVVGGGPSGSMAAIEIAKAGFTVCVLEKDRDIGMPVRCGEAIGYQGLTQFFKPKKEWIATEINAAELIAPNGKNIKVPFVHETGFILNRRIFDYDVSRYAVKNGAEVYTKSYVKDLIIDKKTNFVNGVVVNHFNKEIKIYSKIVVGADGVESRVGRWGGIKTTVKIKDMESCLQYSVANINLNKNQMKMYVGKKYAPGGYLWIFPKGEGFANIGIGISGKYSKHKSAKAYLDEFIKKNHPDVSVLSAVCGGVSCPKPHKNPISDGLILVGDAAHQINPMTGGGIASGMRGGQIGGKVIVESLKKENYSKSFLSAYPKEMFKVFGNNHNRYYRIKEAIHQLNDEDFNYIANKVENIPENKRGLSDVFKAAVYKKPSLMLDVLKVFVGL